MRPGRSRPGRTRDPRGLLFDLDTFAVHDGPGIRMAVYLKGCPLACAWCHSPESQQPRPELISIQDRCRRCGACVAACPRQVHAVGPGGHQIARDLCQACGRCVEVCDAGALAVKGHRVSASEVVARAIRMAPFFRHSGGGVTLTGGEVTRQPAFAEAVLAGCRAAGIHTAIETCGACAWPVLERLLRHTDLVLLDVKLADPDEHRRWTGAGNRRILRNARRLAGRAVQVRVPLIPGITDTPANLAAVFAFLRETGLREVALLPCNPSTGAKYEWLGRPCPVAPAPQTAAALAAIADRARAYGLAPVIPGQSTGAPA